MGYGTPALAMSVLNDIGPGLIAFTYEHFGDFGLHDLAAEFLAVKIPKPRKDEQEQLLADIAHEEPLFTSWLWHDYRMKDGDKSVLELFSEKKADQLTDSEKRRLQQLINSQVFSLFKVGSVRPGNIELTDLVSGTTYNVREYSLANQVEAGMCMHLRLCRQDDHWEIIVPNGILPLRLDASLIELIENELPKDMTIKDSFAYQQLLKGLGFKSSPEAEEPKDLSAARTEFKAALKRTGVDKYITLEGIEKLMSKELKDKNKILSPPSAIRLLVGLVGPEKDSQANDLITAATDLWNALGPSKEMSKRQAKGYTPDLLISAYNHFGWGEYADAASEHIAKGMVDEAINDYEQLFTKLLSDKTTTASLYRILANAASLYLADGNSLLGSYLLKQALELCPGYDFALEQDRLLKDGYYDNAISSKTASIVERNGITKPLLLEETRNYSDQELLNALDQIGINIEPSKLPKLIAKSKSSDQVLFKIFRLNKDDPNIDDADALIDAARERWAEDVVWPDTLHEYALELDAAVFPESADGSIKKPNFKVIDTVLSKFLESLNHANKPVIKAWMNDTIDYADHRQNIVYATLTSDPSLNTSIYKKCRQLCHQLLLTTKDQIFSVPDILEKARAGKSVKNDVTQLAVSQPMDHIGLQIIADELSILNTKAAIFIYELALEALDKRVQNSIWENPPYDYEILGGHYEYIFGQLEDIYIKTGNMSRSKQVNKRYESVVDDDRLWHTLRLDKLNAYVDNMAMFVEKDNPIISYLEWFKTLGISLTQGDGHETRLTPPRSTLTGQKIGRNEPCPCGAAKPDGSPIKYKYCHGAIKN